MKSYPVLLKLSDTEEYLVSKELFESEEKAIEYYRNKELNSCGSRYNIELFQRLLIDIPELIELEEDKK